MRKSRASILALHFVHVALLLGALHIFQYRGALFSSSSGSTSPGSTSNESKYCFAKRKTGLDSSSPKRFLSISASSRMYRLTAASRAASMKFTGVACVLQAALQRLTSCCAWRRTFSSSTSFDQYRFSSRPIPVIANTSRVTGTLPSSPLLGGCAANAGHRARTCVNSFYKKL